MKALWRMVAAVFVGILAGPLVAEEAVTSEKGLAESVKFVEEVKIEGFKENYFLRFRKE